VKRVLLSISATIAGIAALLGFKTQTSTLQQAGSLPSASLGDASQQGGSTTQTPSSDTASIDDTTQNTGTGDTASSSSAAPSTAPSSTAPSSSTAASSSAASKSRTLVGAAEQTQYGVVQVQVTVSGSKITGVQFLQLTAYDRRSQEINSAAAPTLLQQTLDAQSANINGVSGATFTSDGYLASLQNALDQL
jgi:uncharacterized protein with FMN-binding domain